MRLLQGSLDPKAILNPGELSQRTILLNREATGVGAIAAENY